MMKALRISGSGNAWFGGSFPPIGRRVRNACLALGLVLMPAAAFADPVRTVTSGGFFSGEEDTGFNLSGTNFQFAVSKVLAPVITCEPCIPGTAFDLRSTVTVRDWPAGSATLDGRTYDSVFFAGSFNFDAGSVIVPDIPHGDGSGTALFSTFMFTGTLAGFADPSLTGPPLFSTDLRGGGSGPFALRVAFSNSSLTPGIRVDQIDYRFDNTAPVPEPGSLLLFGSGAAWVAARWRKRRHDTEDPAEQLGI